MAEKSDMEFHEYDKHLGTILIFVGLMSATAIALLTDINHQPEPKEEADVLRTLVHPDMDSTIFDVSTVVWSSTRGYPGSNIVIRWSRPFALVRIPTDKLQAMAEAEGCHPRVRPGPVTGSLPLVLRAAMLLLGYRGMLLAFGM